MENNPETALAWQFIENTGTHLFLTGKAGTGKTTFLRKLKAESPKRMIVLAPTGIAAINAGGVTIHSFFQLPFAPYVPESSFSADGKAAYRFRFGKEKINIIRSIDLLVIDEISMVRADLLDSVDAVLRRFRDRSKPFGGVQLLMIGDLQQLAPVVKDEEWQLLLQQDIFVISPVQKTCLPFSKELFLTSKGKILPCETIARMYPLGYVTDKNNVILSPIYIADLYNEKVKEQFKYCSSCCMLSFCFHCLFQVISVTEQKRKCPQYMGQKEFMNYLKVYVDYLELYPFEYSHFCIHN